MAASENLFSLNILKHNFDETTLEVSNLLLGSRALTLDQIFTTLKQNSKNATDKTIQKIDIKDSLLILHQKSLLSIKGGQNDENSAIKSQIETHKRKHNEEQKLIINAIAEENKLSFSLRKENIFPLLRVAKYAQHLDTIFPREKGSLIIKMLGVCGLANEESIKDSFTDRLMLQNQKISQGLKRSKLCGETNVEIDSLKDIMHGELDRKYDVDKDIDQSVVKDSKNSSEDFDSIFNKLISSEYIDPVRSKENKDILYRINPAMFERDLLNKKIVKFVEKMTEPTFSLIIEAMLDSEEHFKESSAHTISNSFNAAHRKKRLHKKMTKPKINACLLEMCQGDNLRMVIKVQGSNSFTINKKGLVAEIRKRTLQAVIQRKLGLYHARIFALLIEEGQLEDHQICDMALLQRNIARSSLYELLDWGFVSLREVPVNSREPSSNKIFYFWSVPLDLVFREYLEASLYKSWIKLKSEEIKAQRDLEEMRIQKSFKDKNEVKSQEDKLTKLGVVLIKTEGEIALFKN